MNWKPAATGSLSDFYLDMHARRAEVLRLRQRRVLRHSCLLLTLLFPVLLLLRESQQLGLDRQHWSQTRRVRLAAETRYRSLQEGQNVLQLRIDRWNEFLATRRRRQAWAALPQIIAASVPPQVYLEQVQIEADKPTDIVSLLGAAENMEAVNVLFKALQKTPLLTDLSLAETTEYPEMGPQAVHFRLQATAGSILRVVSSTEQNQ